MALKLTERATMKLREERTTTKLAERATMKLRGKGKTTKLVEILKAVEGRVALWLEKKRVTNRLVEERVTIREREKVELVDRTTSKLVGERPFL